MNEACLFCRIASGEIPAERVAEGEDWLAFRDVEPQAPTHVLIIPRRHIATVNDIHDEDRNLIGELVDAARQIAGREGIADGGYRIVLNCNVDGGQSVFHIHLHLLGGRPMTWPPG